MWRQQASQLMNSSQLVCVGGCGCVRMLSRKRQELLPGRVVADLGTNAMQMLPQLQGGFGLALTL